MCLIDINYCFFVKFNFYHVKYYKVTPIPVAARSKAWVCGRSLVEIASSSPAGGMDVCCECCVLSDKVFRGRPITHLEGCYRVCVCVCLSMILELQR